MVTKGVEKKMRRTFRTWVEGERVPFESELPEQLEAEQRRTRQHRRRAEEEKQRADALAAEVERLRAELQRRTNEK